LQIVIYYDRGAQTANDMNYMIAAIRCRSRVHGTTFQGQVFQGDDGSFPVLESLELGHGSGLPLVLPSTFLRGSAPNLRTLKLRHVSQKSLSQLLSSATGLVELSLSFSFFVCPSAATPLLGYLQGFPCLRRLQLHAQVPIKDVSATTGPTLTESVVRLPN
jgi:hypothetical protein